MSTIKLDNFTIVQCVLCFSAVHIFAYFRIIYRLGQRDVVNDETEQQRAASVKKQVLKMLVANAVVFFLLHLPVMYISFNLAFNCGV